VQTVLSGSPVSTPGVDTGLPDNTVCTPMAAYGPMPCTSDAECEQTNAVGWYCDTQNTFSDGCGGTIAWPVCRPTDLDAAPPAVDACPPVAWYGPPPCTSEAECVAQNGAGWYCATPADPCAPPVCAQAGTTDAGPYDAGPIDAAPLDAAPIDIDAYPPAYYGPMPVPDSGL
jgi:hypothetical protein